jgi:hypothetical protein
VQFMICLLVLLLAAVGPAHSQDAPQNASKLGTDFRGEGDRFKKSCESFSLASLESCAELLFTDHPLHIAVGSIAPENGFGAGGAFVAHYTPNESWRLSWDTDAIASTNGSWRAGVYMKAIYTGPKKESTGRGRPAKPESPNQADLKRPYFNVYTQAISLNKIDYFGLGPTTTLADRSFFGMREIIPGVNAIAPLLISKWLNPSLYGEANGRFVDVRGSYGQPSPSIEQLYTEANAPGLRGQPSFVQFGEGLRLQPAYGDHIKLNYFVVFQQFIGAGDSHFSFRRFMVDLSHEFPIYKTMRSVLPKDHNGPDDCSESIEDRTCPTITHDREGAFTVRLLISESLAPAGHVVPFYFDPTLGGSDINGNSSLSSFQDYRFRAPNLLLLQGTFEHSIYGPLGVSFGAEGGKVSLTRSNIDFTNLEPSYSAGLTLRAGGFPQVSLLFAWGGGEGTHTIANVNASLLGGSTRPSLF